MLHGRLLITCIQADGRYAFVQGDQKRRLVNILRCNNEPQVASTLIIDVLRSRKKIHITTSCVKIKHWLRYCKYDAYTVWQVGFFCSVRDL